MAELSVLLKSGKYTDLKLGDLEVSKLISVVAQYLTEGVSIPDLSSVDAANGTVFYNTDIGKLCFKRPDGFTVKFSMEVI